MNEDVEIENIAEDVYERRTFIIDKGQEPLRIDKWLQIRIEGATRNKIQKGIDSGFVTVNNKNIKSNYKVKPGDEILVMTFVNPEYSELKAENIPLNIVYEDADVDFSAQPVPVMVHVTSLPTIAFPAASATSAVTVPPVAVSEFFILITLGSTFRLIRCVCSNSFTCLSFKLSGARVVIVLSFLSIEIFRPLKS